MSVIDPANVSACLVTRGDTDLTEIIASLPYGEIIVYDNSVEKEDLKTFGRYAAAERATKPVVYFQDDDTIFRQHEALMDAYRDGELIAVYGHGENPAGYEDIAIFPGGALINRDLIFAPFQLYWQHFPRDEDFLYYCDYVFGALVPSQQIHLPFEIRPLAYNGKRLADEPWAREAKARIASQARSLR